ncbi:MAG: hypothetical protein P9M15_00885 [Candidatus Electryoneaceae bacterium]|nr:hypothetical protein [Candidatus Electryoneaceae bacterium]
MLGWIKSWLGYKKTYKVAGRKWVQTVINPEQFSLIGQEVFKLIRDESVEDESVIEELLKPERIGGILAILMVPEGEQFDVRKIDEHAKTIIREISAERGVKVIIDFFTLNPVSSGIIMTCLTANLPTTNGRGLIPVRGIAKSPSPSRN